MGSLLHGESKSDEVWFTKVDYTCDYDKIKVNLYWYDKEGNYHY